MTAIIVTGANGYIGHAVIAAAHAQGIKIIALARHNVFDAATQFVPYKLERDNDLSALPAGAPVIHLAVDVQRPEINKTATARLLDWAQQHHSRLVFISSQTARADAPTPYGRSKAEIETLLHTADNTYIVRPGLVYGGIPRGLYGQLCKLIVRMPLLPAFVPAPRVQPVHVDELAAALIKLATLPAQPRRIYCLGSVRPVSFTDFMQDIATAMKVRRLYIPVPVVFIVPLLKLAPFISTRLQAPLVGLRSLFDLPAMETQASSDTLNISLRPLHHQQRRSTQLRDMALQQQTIDAAFHDRTRPARFRSIAILPLALLREAYLFILGRR